MDEFVSRCGYCGDVIDYCQGHGEDERAEFGFDYDSDEYEARREFFERDDRPETKIHGWSRRTRSWDDV